MTHRKVLSQGSIPFSWEDKPGVCKTHNNECPLHIGQFGNLALQPPQLPPTNLGIQDTKKIPLPPSCSSQPAPRRSTSGKGFRWQEDPFLVAYKECTRSEKNVKLPKKGAFGSNLSVRRGKYILFSCRSSVSDVRDDNFVKLSQLPRLPGDHRSRSLTLEDEQKRSFNYQSWL